MSSILNIYSRPMHPAEAEAVYRERGSRDFPSNELKPFSMIQELINSGCYECCGFYKREKDALCAYAFMMADADADMLLLDYFAVCEEVRGKGYGSAALRLLKANYTNWNGMIFEVEDDDAAGTEAERQLRQRRIAFYERNGVVMTKQKSRAFGVDFKLMVMGLGGAAAEDNVGYFLESMYRKMLPEKIFEKQFRLR
ncbi:MAG: GNAT family N-acetyltransferase [Blautia sp.]|nr:GNAT family N-acetyltransferase [Blautia sp.]MCM1202217.1 GNAT family N-acetyltransferase [Bacteroides fragilis]